MHTYIFNIAEEISSRDKGIPLRLRPGREDQKKSKKYMTSYEVRQHEENQNRKNKRAKKYAFIIFKS